MHRQLYRMVDGVVGHGVGLAVCLDHGSRKGVHTVLQVPDIQGLIFRRIPGILRGIRLLPAILPAADRKRSRPRIISRLRRSRVFRPDRNISLQNGILSGPDKILRGCVKGLGAEIIGKGQTVSAAFQQSLRRSGYLDLPFPVFCGYLDLIGLHVILGPAQASQGDGGWDGNLIVRRRAFFLNLSRDLHTPGILLGLLLCQRIPIQSHNTVHVKMSVFKYDPADLPVEIAHSRHIQVQILIIIPAHSAGQGKGHICDHRMLPCFPGIVGDPLHSQGPGAVILPVITVKVQNVQGLLIGSGYHPVGKLHIARFIHLQNRLGCFTLHQAVVHHIAPDRHRNAVGACLRDLRRNLRVFLRCLQMQGVFHSLLDSVGRVGSSGHSVYLLDPFRVLIRQTGQGFCHSLCGCLQLAAVYICVSAPEIFPGDIHPGNDPLCHIHIRENIILAELIYMEGSLCPVGIGGVLCRCGPGAQRLPEGPQGHGGCQKPCAPLFHGPISSHLFLLMVFS